MAGMSSSSGAKPSAPAIPLRQRARYTPIRADCEGKLQRTGNVGSQCGDSRIAPLRPFCGAEIGAIGLTPDWHPTAWASRLRPPPQKGEDAVFVDLVAHGAHVVAAF